MVDGLVAVGLGAGACAQIALGAHHTPAMFVSGLVVTASVAWRRRAPIAAAVAAVGGFAAFGWAAAGPNPLVLAAVALVFFSLGQRAAASRGDLWVAAGVVAASVAVAVFTRGKLSLLDAASGWALFVGAPSSIGNALARRARLVASLDGVTRQLRDEHEAIAAQAAAEERLRIARELHDIVAHRVTVMVIHTAAARRVASADPNLASESLRHVEQGGREALIEMRRVIGLLHREGAALQQWRESRPERHRRPGRSSAAIRLGRRDRDPRSAARVPPELDSVALRVVQEALTNTLKHACPVKASVTITYSERELHVEIVDSRRVRGRHRRRAGVGCGLRGCKSESRSTAVVSKPAAKVLGVSRPRLAAHPRCGFGMTAASVSSGPGGVLGPTLSWQPGCLRRSRPTWP